ncbi:murein L,D-transpeptidase family protein [Aquabacterium sp.]|uniref:L,D-transpeptidase family protein n=1 Tax=Aquabacterium sp. TaxID=1872578 RepID=UPI0035B2DB61
MAAAIALGLATPAWSAGEPKLSPEARLIEVYKLIGAGNTRAALQKAEALTQDVPTFQLAQLVYGDLLMAQTGAISSMGNAPAGLVARAPQKLDQLRTEARRRLSALQERPPTNAVPAQFVQLPSTTRHAIAVDASRSRLYLFENGPNGLKLVSDHYASIGRLGADKSVQGDQRTPLGVYYITSRLEGKQLTDFYGSGALPLNYPNEYDRRLGRTGHGIWLHGVPSDSFARSPNSTDGCVALSNPELQGLLERVEPRTTPVVIAKNLDWVAPQQSQPQQRSLHNLLEGWRVARVTGDMARLLSFYSEAFAGNGVKDLGQWRQTLQRENAGQRNKSLELKDVAILKWQDRGDVMVVTFGELTNGQRNGPIKRQYWGKENGLWKIFYEGVIG